MHAYSVEITALANFVLDKVKGKQFSVHECDVRVWLTVLDFEFQQFDGKSFLIQSHIILAYTLMDAAFNLFDISLLLNLKQMFYICLYISYTYICNEVTYPVWPFLVEKKRSTSEFWGKCLAVSMSGVMMKANTDHLYYKFLHNWLLTYL